MAIMAVLCFSWLVPSHEDPLTFSKAEISDVRKIVRLCATDIYNEVPVIDTINNKVLVAIQKQRGSISFDVDKISMDQSGDTIFINLPPEIIEIHEASDPDSWDVIDSQNISFLNKINPFATDRLTDEEEKAVKAKVMVQSKKRLYDKGIVKKAREDGAKTLKEMMEKIYRRPVIVKS